MTDVPGLTEWVGAALPTTGRTVSITSHDPGAVTVADARASPGALPLGDAAADCVVLDRVLPALDRPDALLAEVRRVLRPAGSVVVVVPAPGRSLGELRRGVRRGLLGAGWVCPTAVDHPGWLLAAADFAVLGDVRAVFRAPAELAPLVAAAHGRNRTGRAGRPWSVASRGWRPPEGPCRSASDAWSAAVNAGRTLLPRPGRPAPAPHPRRRRPPRRR
ncbi:methyltransferase domain-containing protein [Pseudonocardia halophobica]|uniref:methyltransferase domain-containing protein n=1 Tax=Pseudonocardia halophobica TaxID=29401 RepID=UPI003D8F5596